MIWKGRPRFQEVPTWPQALFRGFLRLTPAAVMVTVDAPSAGADVEGMAQVQGRQPPGLNRTSPGSGSTNPPPPVTGSQR
jgi:hypothetical protein